MRHSILLPLLLLAALLTACGGDDRAGSVDDRRPADRLPDAGTRLVPIHLPGAPAGDAAGLHPDAAVPGDASTGFSQDGRVADGGAAAEPAAGPGEDPGEAGEGDPLAGPPPRLPQEDPMCPYAAPATDFSCADACARMAGCGEGEDPDCEAACARKIRAFRPGALERIGACLETIDCAAAGEPTTPGSGGIAATCMAAQGYPLPADLAVLCHDLERHALGCGADLGQVQGLRAVCLTLGPNLHTAARSRMAACAGAACAEMVRCLSASACVDVGLVVAEPLGNTGP